MLPDNGTVLATYIAGAHTRTIPPEVLDAARMCLTDWMSVAIGAGEEPAGRIVRQTVAGWRTGGSASVMFGTKAAAPMAALANGTLAHCLDFDDTNTDAVTHTSAPVWAATLALGEDIGASEQEMLRAYITGFEVAARVGAGLGQAVTARGFHGTGVFGRLGAAAASATLLKLDAAHALHALGLAATQTSGLSPSFGTMAKPFHAGKAGMDGVLSAQLAANGMIGGTTFFEPGGGLDNALIQDRSLGIAKPDFSDWRILRNSFKPYAACHLTHPAIDAARAAIQHGLDLAAVDRIEADVGALAHQVTGSTDGRPDTPLKAKFDLRYCVALALTGHDCSAADFREPWTQDPSVAAVAEKVQVAIHPDMGFASAALTFQTPKGPTIEPVPVAKGHPGNPMTWDDMRRKFDGLAPIFLGNRAADLFDLLGGFGSGQSLPGIRTLLEGLPQWT